MSLDTIGEMGDDRSHALVAGRRRSSRRGRFKVFGHDGGKRRDVEVFRAVRKYMYSRSEEADSSPRPQPTTTLHATLYSSLVYGTRSGPLPTSLPRLGQITLHTP